MSRNIEHFQESGSDKHSRKKKRAVAPRSRAGHAQGKLPGSTNYILNLQRTLGNRTAGELLRCGYLQADPHIAPSNDAYEQEAGRIAGQIMRMPEPRSRHPSETHKNKENTLIQTKSVNTTDKPLVQRKFEPEDEEAEPESTFSRDTGERVELSGTQTAPPGRTPDTEMQTARKCRQRVHIQLYDQTGTGCNAKTRMQFLAYRCVKGVTACNKRRLLNDISAAGLKACRQFCTRKNCAVLSFVPPKQCGLYRCDPKSVQCLEPKCPTFNECFYRNKSAHHECQCVEPRNLPIS